MKHPFTPVIATALFLLSGLTPRLALADDFNPLHLRTYSQQFTLRFASPEDAAKAELQATPVFDGKTWAFSARWDDNRPNDFPVHDAMAAAGLKGTFYLNHSDRNFGADKALKLMEGGFSIGGHTQTHPLLTSLNANEAFYEILANRVERESETDRTINSFAFPFGRYATRGVPQIQTDITRMLVRSGFYNTTYMDFARNNPDLLPDEFSTGHQVGPGDHQVDAANFDKQVQRVLAHPEQSMKQSHLIHIGVHAGQFGDELKKLADVFKSYGGKSDWWYCNMTQYAAYDRQFHYHQLELVSRDGAACTYRLTRPVPAELGDDVPLTFEVKNARPIAAAADGFACELSESSGRALLNVGHGPHQNAPTRIDAINNDNNAPAPAAAADVKSADFPDIHAWLTCDAEAGQLHLAIENAGTSAMEDTTVTFRLPPIYIDGLIRQDIGPIAPGQKRDIDLPLGAQHDGTDYRAGRAYFVAELNFRRAAADEADRLFVTTRLPAPPPIACVRDATWMAGALAESDIHLDELTAASMPGAAPQNFGQTPDKQWFTSSVRDRERFSTDRVICWRPDREWKKAAGKFDYKPQCYLVAVDFTLSQPAAIKLQTEGKVLGLLLNGKPISGSTAIEGAVAGANRLLIALSISDGRASYGPFPIYLKLTPDAGVLTYATLPAAP